MAGNFLGHAAKDELLNAGDQEVTAPETVDRPLMPWPNFACITVLDVAPDLHAESVRRLDPGPKGFRSGFNRMSWRSDVTASRE